MNHAVTGLASGVLAVAAIETVQAVATRHLRRLGLCALAGAAVAIAVVVFALSKRHKQLAAAAAAGHEPLAHLVAVGAAGLALIITVGAYLIATIMGRRRARRWPAARSGTR